MKFEFINSEKSDFLSIESYLLSKLNNEMENFYEISVNFELNVDSTKNITYFNIFS
jgi:hypothetical protein